jgi:RNA polymerase sigma factor (sigma-70 family)
MLYEETSQDLLAFLLRRCRTTDDAADCLSETYRIAWEKHDRIPAGDEARPWLFGVARNVVRREVTHDDRSAVAARELALSTERVNATVVPEDSAVSAALSQLSPLDQEIVMMLSWDELRPREVALVLGLSPNLVRVRAHRARGKLRALMAPSEEGGDPALDKAASTSARNSV